MAAPEIHSAFRGRLMCLLVLRTPGHTYAFLPQKSPCISYAGVVRQLLSILAYSFTETE